MSKPSAKKHYMLEGKKWIHQRIWQLEGYQTIADTISYPLQDRAFHSARWLVVFLWTELSLDWFLYGQPVFVWTGFLPDVLLSALSVTPDL